MLNTIIMINIINLNKKKLTYILEDFIAFYIEIILKRFLKFELSLLEIISKSNLLLLNKIINCFIFFIILSKDIILIIYYNISI
jgi:hypothetical protein